MSLTDHSRETLRLSNPAVKRGARSFTSLLPGAPGGIRTPNLLIRSQMLYPLSYRRLFSCPDRAVAVIELSCSRSPERTGRATGPRKPRPSAEAEGFEPSVPLRAQHISSVSHSAALARFPGPPWGGHRRLTLPGVTGRGQNARCRTDRATLDNAPSLENPQPK